MLLRRQLYYCNFCQFLMAVLWFDCFNTSCGELTTVEPSLQLCSNSSIDCDLLEPGQYPSVDSMQMYTVRPYLIQQNQFWIKTDYYYCYYYYYYYYYQKSTCTLYRSVHCALYSRHYGKRLSLVREKANFNSHISD